jgi:Pyruvate/2-oxoacid:ferredoxin oxidoreductase gamma subunit
LEALFRYEVLKMLKAEGKISDAVIENMVSWRHSGINVYCGPTFWPNNDQGLEDISRHIVLAKALEIGDTTGRIANVVMMGALSKIAPFNQLPEALWLLALKAVTPAPALWGGNHNAFKAGRELIFSGVQFRGLSFKQLLTKNR